VITAARKAQVRFMHGQSISPKCTPFATQEEQIDAVNLEAVLT
jgi:hypothetical protein